MCNEMNELVSAIWILNLAKYASINGKLIKKIIESSGGLIQLFDIDINIILEIMGGPPEKIIKAKTFLKDNSNKISAYESGCKNFKSGVKVLSINNKNYPVRLINISSPPPILFYRGNNATEILRSDYFVSVVGTRNPTAYGKSVTKMIVGDLVKRGVVIVSGMARGIDSIAHQTALENNGKTIAVLGCGVDVVYPPENKVLMQDIIKNGIVISECLPSTKPFRSYFPARNRLISGLCDSLAIMEAATKSGTMITAGFAGDQGKDLFAVPGSIFSPESQGTNQLIQDGACVLSKALDLLWKYPLRVEDLCQNEMPESIGLDMITNISMNNDNLPGEPVFKKLKEILLYCEKTMDEIALLMGYSTEKTAEILSLYEISGKVISQNGRFSLTDSFK